jgi:hypothetical protein
VSPVPRPIARVGDSAADLTAIHGHRLLILAIAFHLNDALPRVDLFDGIPPAFRSGAECARTQTSRSSQCVDIDTQIMRLC